MFYLIQKLKQKVYVKFQNLIKNYISSKCHHNFLKLFILDI